MGKGPSSSMQLPNMDRTRMQDPAEEFWPLCLKLAARYCLPHQARTSMSSVEPCKNDAMQDTHSPEINMVYVLSQESTEFPARFGRRSCGRRGPSTGCSSYFEGSWRGSWVRCTVLARYTSLHRATHKPETGKGLVLVRSSTPPRAELSVHCCVPHAWTCKHQKKTDQGRCIR